MMKLPSPFETAASPPPQGEGTPFTAEVLMVRSVAAGHASRTMRLYELGAAYFLATVLADTPWRGFRLTGLPNLSSILATVELLARALH